MIRRANPVGSNLRDVAVLLKHRTQFREVIVMSIKLPNDSDILRRGALNVYPESTGAKQNGYYVEYPSHSNVSSSATATEKTPATPDNPKI